jgi:ABC-2 type transport system permease protein/oleandomycin transport system permease protein
MTTAAITPPGLLTEPGLDDRLRWAISDTITMTRRDLIRTARQPEMWTFAVTMGAFFLLLFYYVFGGAIGAGTGVDYIQFLVPGVLVITALNGAQQTGNSLAVDLSEGVVDRLRSLPMNQGAVLTGRTIADTLRNTLTLVVVAVLGYLLGFRFSNLGAAVGGVLLAVGLGFSFSWISAAIAAKVRNVEMVGMLSMFWLFPLLFASSAFTPTAQMPGWLQAFADNQPISVVADAIRALGDGTGAGGLVLGSLLWIVGLTAFFGWLSARLYRKGA